MNPFQYTQVNIREQCSWTHTDDKRGATEKAMRLVRAGINRTRLTEPLEPIVVETTRQEPRRRRRHRRPARGARPGRDRPGRVPRREGAAARRPGGRLRDDVPPRPQRRRAHRHARGQEVRAHPAVTVFTNAELVAKSGSFGNYRRHDRHPRRAPGDHPGRRRAPIVVATGFDNYEPAAGELGYGLDGVVTLPEFKKLLDEADRPAARTTAGRSRRRLHLLRRQPPGRERRRRAHLLLALLLHGRRARGAAGGRQARRRRCASTTCTATCAPTASTSCSGPSRAQKGSLYLRVPDDEPPAVEKLAAGGLKVTARDLLTGGEELTIPADLVVLVTGMVPRENDGLVSTLKLPVGNDGFFNEIHPKLRPVETVVDGVCICGACQSPKTSAESVASGLAAVTQSGAMLKRGFAELDPHGRHGRRRCLHLVRQVPRGLPLRRHRAGRGRRQGRRRDHHAPPARAAAAACRCVPRTPSTCWATPTPRSEP